MKYLSVMFIILAILVTFITNYCFENAGSPQLIANVMSIFWAPFYTATSGVNVEPTPFYLVEKNSTYILISAGVTLSLVASMIEIVKLMKFGKNQQSACVIALSVCLLYFNASIFAWNT
ncbi:MULTISPECIES: hypothetical protein [unclassified Agarivorans]|uniref:hypothetical protein n=1 Tax=unclassified Agarivorans TaxID=2636026 RepID=UPI003D7CBFA4